MTRSVISATERNGPGWSWLLAQDLDPEAVLVETTMTTATRSKQRSALVFALAIHNGADHRSQICTVLTNLGLQPPAIDAWDFGLDNGRVAEVSPST